MNIYIAEIKAIDPVDGILKTWHNRIEAISWKHAEYIVEHSEKGYMNIVSELVSEVDSDSGKIIDYYTYKLN